MEQLIDKTSGIPIYQQLKERLEDAISHGQLCPGKRIPSENELSRQYGIHRHTVRNSLRQLAEEGVLQSVPGSGWFVRPPDVKTLRVGVINFVHGKSSNILANQREMAFLDGAAHSGCRLCDVTLDDLDKISSFKLDALVFANMVPDVKIHRELLEKQEIPIIISNRQIFGSDFPYVAIDQYYGTRELVARLTDAGHTRIGYIASDLPLRYVSQRFRGYCDALTEAGIDFSEGLCCKVKDSSDFRGMVRDLFSRNPEMTALFVGGEVFHAQTFEALKELKLRVPEDVSLVLYDRPNNEYSYATYLEQPWNELGLRLFKMVRKVCNGEKANSEIINTEIINGKSIKKLN